MFSQISSWPTNVRFVSKSSGSTSDSWQSGGSQGSTPPPDSQSAWWGTEARQLMTSSHGSVWEDSYKDIFGARPDGEDDSYFHRRILPTEIEMMLRDKKPDLLDRLVMEDLEERMKKFVVHQQHYHASNQHVSSLPLENILKLLQLQQDPGFATPKGRAITRSSGKSKIHAMPYENHTGSTFPANIPYRPQKMIHNDYTRKSVDSSTVPCRVSPLSFKASPPHHPPAVPADPIAITLSMAIPTKGSAAAVRCRVQEAMWQFQALEVERKKMEAALALQNPGMRISSSNSVQIPRLPPSPSKLDKLLVDSLREQARVLTLLHRIGVIQRIKGFQGLANILATWKETILHVIAIRRQEKMKQEEQREQLEESLSCMSLATRKTRTAVWTMLMIAGKKEQ